MRNIRTAIANPCWNCWMPTRFITCSQWPGSMQIKTVLKPKHWSDRRATFIFRRWTAVRALIFFHDKFTWNLIRKHILNYICNDCFNMKQHCPYSSRNHSFHRDIDSLCENMYCPNVVIRSASCIIPSSFGNILAFIVERSSGGAK